jgi:hypothetical protein
MSNSIEVVEQEILLPYLVSSFDINIIIIQLNVQATIIVNTFDKDGNKLYEKLIIIEGEDYSNWGNNDNYLKNLVALKLGLQIKSSIIELENIELIIEDFPSNI